MGSYQTVTIGGKTVFKYTNPEGRTVFSDIPPTPDQILQEPGGESSDDSAVCDNRCMGRIQTLQDTYHVTRAQAEDMYRREQDTKAQQERRLKDVEEAREQGRLRALLEEEAELAKAEEALSVTSIAKDVFLPQSKLDWVLLLGGAIGKVGKGSNAVYKVLSREKALEKLRKRRQAIKEALEAKKAKKAEEGLHIEQQVAKRMEKLEVQCFKRGAGNKASIAEYERQLAAQEKALNEMSVGDFQKARDFYKQSGRHPDAADATARFRENFQNEQTDKLIKQKVSAGMGQSQASAEAVKEAADMMKGLDALHTPDLIAGGDFRPTDMGSSSANRSIGGQWPQNSRIQSVDKAAGDAAKTLGKDAKMNVKLVRCK